MDKILLIGKDIQKPKTGGEICCFNNQLILKKIFESGFYKYVLTNNSFLSIFLNKLIFLYPGLKISDIKKIESLVVETSPNYIFIETAMYGKLAKILKNRFPNIKIITFFHNVEIQYARSYLKWWKIKSWYYYYLAKINEKNSVIFSDYIFTITKNDSVLLYEEYNHKASEIMSFSIQNLINKDILNSLIKTNKKISKKECLFVGSNFFGNTEGLNWFIKEILPYTDIHLTIVGNGMSNMFIKTDKIDVYDFVDDLSIFYRQTDFVVLPIISGGGMKTKTAEAMMWGKAIIGTNNSFIGYEIKECHGIYNCNTPNEFIKAIQNIYSDDIYYFNENIYQRFKNYHSTDIIQKRIYNFFSNLEK